MSDSYVALIDTEASGAEAQAIAAKTVVCLQRHGLIETELSADCVLGGQGFPAGPRCSQVYRGKGQFWTLQTSGVEVDADPWINVFGSTVFETATCPQCGHVHGEEFLEQLVDAMDAFTRDHRVPSLACSACGASTRIHEWACVPHLGFVNFAIVFWNWPPFDTPGWNLDVPAMLHTELGRPLVATYGHV